MTGVYTILVFLLAFGSSVQTITHAGLREALGPANSGVDSGQIGSRDHFVSFEHRLHSRRGADPRIQSLQQVFFGFAHEHSRGVFFLDRPANSVLTSTGIHVKEAPTLKAISRQIEIAKRIDSRVWIDLEQNRGEDHQSRHDLLNWAVDTTTSAPNTTDRETLINLARMTSDAYSVDPSAPDWLNITNGFNSSTSFGWNDTGLRGHVFANPDNSTVIIAFKGTSVDPRDAWASNDKLNDNLLFSCCCATQRPDPYWYGEVCDCHMDTYKCNSTCLTTSLIGNRTYYPTALNVYLNVTLMYPNADIWTVGHSMGGAVASLVGLTFNVPAVTFESPPQALAAQRLGLAVHPDPRFHGAYHFGNTADPVYMGACNGWTSSCAIGGLAFESQCFTGQRCVYDTVADKGWRMSIINHRINYVISNVLEAYDTVANCSVDDECVDCYEWYFS